MLDRRMQLMLDGRRYDKIAKLARQRGVPVAAVIRDAIDQLVDDDEWDVRRRAIRAILAAESIEVPADPRDLRRELDDARGRTVP